MQGVGKLRKVGLQGVCKSVKRIRVHRLNRYFRTQPPGVRLIAGKSAEKSNGLRTCVGLPARVHAPARVLEILCTSDV